MDRVPMDRVPMDRVPIDGVRGARGLAPPSWRIGVAIIRRDEDLVHIGEDPRPFRLRRDEERWLRGLGRFPSWDQAWAEFPGRRARAQELVDRASALGALQPPDECWWLSPKARIRAQAELLALSAWHEDPQQAMAARSACTVAVIGDGAIVECVRSTIHALGLGQAPEAASATADVVVVAGANVGDAPAALFRDREHLLEIPHLPVSIHRAQASIGPLVIPGRSACLRCLHLHKRDADAAWPLMSEQWSRERATWSTDADPLLVHLAAASVGAVLRQWVDDPDRVGSRQLRWSLPGLLPTQRDHSAHPTCGCLWPSPARSSADDDPTT